MSAKEAKVYLAHYLGGYPDGYETPEVIIPQFEQLDKRSMGFEFFLAGEAMVIVDGKTEKWGKIKSQLKSREWKMAFEVRVIDAVWEFGPVLPPGMSPEEIIERFRSFKGTINRRNRLTEGLREENRRLRKRLATVGGALKEK